MAQGGNPEPITNWFFDYNHIRHVETPGVKYNNEEDFRAAVIEKYRKAFAGENVSTKKPRYGANSPTVNVVMPDIEALKAKIAALEAERAKPEPQVRVAPVVVPEPVVEAPEPVNDGRPYTIKQGPGIGWYNVVDKDGFLNTEKTMRKNAAESLVAELNGG